MKQIAIDPVLEYLLVRAELASCERIQRDYIAKPYFDRSRVDDKRFKSASERLPRLRKFVRDYNEKEQ